MVGIVKHPPGTECLEPADLAELLESGRICKQGTISIEHDDWTEAGFQLPALSEDAQRPDELVSEAIVVRNTRDLAS